MIISKQDMIWYWKRQFSHALYVTEMDNFGHLS